MKEGEGKDVAASTVDARTSPSLADAADVAKATPADLADASTAPLSTPADVTRTSNEPVGTPSEPSGSDAPDEPRLAAPLQTRDPGRYKVIGEHGRGGIGRVLRAHDKELGRDIAVKELLERGSVSEVRFLREALITARLEHPGIVPVHEAGRWPDGTPFYAMKLVSGSSLKVLIDKAKTLEERLALIPNVIAVADAIAYAHDRKIIHRDLKPSNVIVGEFGETVVIDWGLAKDLDDYKIDVGASPYRDRQHDELTGSNSVIGTPAYMAPEQRAGVTEERTDIYALGGLLFSLLYGHSPQAPRPATTAQGSKSPPKDLIAVASRAMETDPKDRYQTVREFGEELRRFLQQSPVRARNYSVLELISRAAAKHRLVTLICLVALVAIGVLSGVAIILLRGQQQKTRTALQSAELALDAVVLEHSELLLKNDPTLALSVLNSYQGNDTRRRRRISAQAFGLGIANSILHPHSDVIRLAVKTKLGIISIGDDRTVVLNSDSATKTIASDVASPASVAIAEHGYHFAYVRSTGGVTVVDGQTLSMINLDVGLNDSICISPDGQTLAGLTKGHTTAAFSISSSQPTTPAVPTPKYLTCKFIDDQHIIILESDRLSLLGNGTASSSPLTASPTSLAVSPESVFVGTGAGTVQKFSRTMELQQTISACSEPVTSLSIVNEQQVAVLCTNGQIRLWSERDQRVTNLLSEPGIKMLWSLGDSKKLIASTDRGIVIVVNTVTGVQSRYRGHSAGISFVGSPGQGSPVILTGDARGAVRVWPVPEENAQLVFDNRATVFTARFSPDGGSIATDSVDGRINLFKIGSSELKSLASHKDSSYGVRFSGSNLLLSASLDGTANLYNAHSGKIVNTFAHTGGAVNDAMFSVDEKSILTIGDDGRLIQWPIATGTKKVLFNGTSALTAVSTTRSSTQWIVVDANGAVWLISEESPASLLRTGNGDRVTLIRSIPNEDIVAVATQSGLISLYKIQSATVMATYQVGAAVRSMEFSSTHPEFLVVSDDGTVHRFSRRADYAVDWDILSLSANHCSYAADGRTLGISTSEGGVWLYEILHSHWAFSADHEAEVSWSEFSADGKYFVSADRVGRVLIRDVNLSITRTAKYLKWNGDTHGTNEEEEARNQD